MAEKAHGSWMKLYVEGNTSVVLSNMAKKVLKQYLEALQAMSAALSKQLGKYDVYSMMVGMSLILQVIIRVIFLLFQSNQDSSFLKHSRTFSGCYLRCQDWLNLKWLPTPYISALHMILNNSFYTQCSAIYCTCKWNCTA